MSSVEDLLVRDIWGEILSRLPAKSILRCRSVCKSWYSLISCLDFISDYSNRGEYLIILGSCNGLICLSYFGYHGLDVTFLLWNPTIRKIVALPSRSYCELTKYPSYLGFGFDSNTSDYKVLCIVSKSIGDSSDIVAYGCEIHDLKKGVWRAISPPVHSSWDVTDPHPECYLNGVVHWSGYGHDKVTDRIILSFDVSDEVFREISMPDSEEFVRNANDLDDHTRTRIEAFNGLINVIVCKVSSYYYIDMSKSCSFWTMKEYGVMESWTKMFNIDLQSAQVWPTTGLWLYFICLLDDDEVLTVHDDIVGKQDLVLYKIGSREWKYILSMTKSIEDPCLYEESLVLMCGRG